MKTKWLLPIVLAVAALGFAAGQRCVSATEPRAGEIFGDTAALEKLLKLTPDQSAKVRALATDFAAKAGDACDKHCEARCDLARKLFRENAPVEELKKCAEAMSAAYSEQEQATLDHLTKLRALLTPEQARVLDRQFAACICKTCAGGSGSCCDSKN